ncbi:MAG TPA: LCP family protein [Candidatus Cybelea sp.]|jgi:LCP family protein required for cell wall assembly|nr:LCP family protein [Candidatus Cybelea sp.]
MFSNRWIRIALAATAFSIIAIAGFFAIRESLRQRIVTETARRSFGDTKLNLLILGYQADEMTTDTIVLARLDVGRRSATLVSIPRDTWLNVPGEGFAKINSAYAFGGAHATARVASKLFGGAPIDAIVALQPEGAAAIVDAMGGLDVNVDESMDYDDNGGDLHIHLKKGEQHLTGDQVAQYVRFREDPASDFGRVRRQQQVLKLLIDQVSEPQNWAKLPNILRIAQTQMHTTMTPHQLLAFLTIYRNVPEDNIRSFTLPSRAGWVGDASVVFADPRWARLIGAVLFGKRDPPQDEVLVANATGNVRLDGTIVGALRGAGWNVPTFVDAKVKRRSLVIGTTPAAAALAKTFATVIRPGTKTALVIGADLAPDTE